MRRTLVAALIAAFTILPSQAASAQAPGNQVVSVHKKVADLSSAGLSTQQAQQLPSCSGEIDIDYQIVTFNGQPFLVQNIVLTALLECNVPVLCAVVLQGAMYPPLTVGVENGDPNNCLVQTAPTAISLPGSIALGEASALDLATGASADFGPYLIVFT